MAAGTTTHLGLATREAGDRLPEALSKTNWETVDAYVAARSLTNKSGSTVAANSVVIVDTTADNSFTTTTTPGVSKVAGVTQASIADDAAGIVKQFGFSSVLVTGATSRGDWLTTGAVAGQAVAVTQDAPPEGAFAIALSATVGAGTVTALLLSVAAQQGGALPTDATPSQTTEGAAVWDSDDDVLTIGDGSSRKTFYPGQPTWEHIDTQVLTGTATVVTFASLSSDYKMFRITAYYEITNNAATVITVNNVTANYDYETVINAVAAATAAGAGWPVATTHSAPGWASFIATISQQAATANPVIVSQASHETTATALQITDLAGSQRNTTVAITEIDITNTGIFKADSRFVLEGCKTTT